MENRRCGIPNVLQLLLGNCKKLLNIQCQINSQYIFYLFDRRSFILEVLYYTKILIFAQKKNEQDRANYHY